jgi:hypothetical protein
VTRFRVRKEFAEKYRVQTVGNSTHKELPAEDLPAFNDYIIGEIEVVVEFHAEGQS